MWQGLPVLQVSLCNGKAVLGLGEDLQPRQGCFVGCDEVAGGGPGPSAHPTPQLMQLCQAKPLGVLHNDN